eukprot:m.57451 g.57451  ORF g.57451 m.57451 type:complete len:546 (-) comp13728_c0_seq1:101-1738(-)
MSDSPFTDVEQAVFTALFYSVADEEDVVGAGDAVEFLRLSGLEDDQLHEIWEQSDSEENGYLDEQGFTVACKLVAMAQAGLVASVEELDAEAPLPDFGDRFADVIEAAEAKVSPKVDWTVTPKQILKYDKEFKAAAKDDMVSGAEARDLLMKSQLPTAVLGRIWELSDVDKDGNLTQDEYVVAVHMIAKCQEGASVPASLPKSLYPTAISALRPAVNTSPWVVSASEKTAYDKFFMKADKENTGLVTGRQVMGIFNSSKLPKAVLARIWGLCDTYSCGSLNAEQFALAMYLISRKVKGTEVPDKLKPEHIPPSCRDSTLSAPPATPLKGQPATPAGAGKTSPTPATVAASDDGDVINAKAELAMQEANNAQLRKAVANTDEEFKAKSKELQATQARLQRLRDEEDKLRQQLQLGKDKLEDLIEQLKKVNADVAKTNGTNNRLRQSSKKITTAVEKFGQAPQVAKGMQSHLQASQQQVSDPFAAMAAAKAVSSTKGPAKAAAATKTAAKGPQRGASTRSARANPGDPFANMGKDPFAVSGGASPWA